MSKLFFMASLCLAAFGYGVGTVHYRVFPFEVLRDANRAWLAMTTTDPGYEESDAGYVDGLCESTVRQYSNIAGDELILVAGGENYLQEHSAGHGCLAWIMDRHGTVQHVWQYDPGLFAELKEVATVPGKKTRIYPVGVHLYADGGLLVCFQGSPSFPYGIGLARFDRDSKLIWKRELHNHHWFSVADDDRIYALTMRAIDSPQTVGSTRFSISSSDGKILQEAVMILDADGNLLDEIPVLEAVIESGWWGLLPTTAATESTDKQLYVINSPDPTHVNDVQLVDSGLAAAHPWLSPGDLLLSLRNMNAVGILDPRTRRFKWMSAGAAVMQHSPRFHADGVLVFDNRGGSVAVGGSRLVHIDLETQIPRTLFPRPEARLPGEFYTAVAGHLDLSGNDRVLVTLTNAQKVWEINLTTGEVLWEYICVDSEKHRRRNLLTAKYVRNVNFPLNREGEGTP